MKEENAHKAICKYIKFTYPDVIFTSDGSGLRLTKGLAAKFAFLKSGRGIPDLLIFEPNKTYKGLFLEVKKADEKIFKKDGTLYADEHLQEQASILDRLQHKGYAAYFCIGSMQGILFIDQYMRNEL
ncbi:hypothetical protein LCGC14_0501030 [marine sediment metagenome]|uniref:VRR-NUC domain-containing protein n=1 Tax=marine sediment metagenome TaxID=412755 RepID=A0A0F9VCH9_9ZZZZ|nr:hypothetical protein [Pricia sp.]